MNLTCHRYHDTPLRLRGSIANFRRLTVDVHRNDSDGNFGICRSSYRFDAVLRMGLSGTTHQIPPRPSHLRYLPRHAGSISG